MSLLNNKFLNTYSPKLAGAMGSIIVASTLFIPSYPPTHWMKWIGLIISILAAALGILISFLTLELKVKLKAEIQNKEDKQIFNDFKEKLQKRYRTNIDVENEWAIIYNIAAREKQFYYHLTIGILEDLGAKDRINVTVDYHESARKNPRNLC